jgi:hypothetical protein
MTLTIAYPQVRATSEPLPLKASRIWELAAAVREQITGGRRILVLEVERLVARTRRMLVNGSLLRTQWDLDQDVLDDRGREALGVTEADSRVPGTILICLNAQLIAGRDYLERSTAAHELAHAIFDGPAMLRHTRERAFAMVTPDEGHLATSTGTGERIDWREFRANVFMGALLAPRDLLHRELVRRANAIGLPLVDANQGEPVLRGRGDPERIEQLHLDLAERFGVSAEFIAYRLQRYALIR